MGELTASDRAVLEALRASSGSLSADGRANAAAIVGAVPQSEAHLYAGAALGAGVLVGWLLFRKKGR